MNMWALYVVGPPLEMWLGRLRFGALAVSALGGSVRYLIAPLIRRDGGGIGGGRSFGATFMVARQLHALMFVGSSRSS